MNQTIRTGGFSRAIARSGRTPLDERKTLTQIAGVARMGADNPSIRAFFVEGEDCLGLG